MGGFLIFSNLKWLIDVDSVIRAQNRALQAVTDITSLGTVGSDTESRMNEAVFALLCFLTCILICLALKQLGACSSQDVDSVHEALGAAWRELNTQDIGGYTDGTKIFNGVSHTTRSNWDIQQYGPGNNSLLKKILMGERDFFERVILPVYAKGTTSPIAIHNIVYRFIAQRLAEQGIDPWSALNVPFARSITMLFCGTFYGEHSILMPHTLSSGMIAARHGFWLTVGGLIKNKHENPPGLDSIGSHMESSFF